MSRKELEILKRTLKNASDVAAGLRKDSSYCTQLPRILGIKLTNRCNLRCIHCYEWNEKGYHHKMSEKEKNEEIDIEILNQLFKDTNDICSNVYLWGGEPFCYSKFSELAGLLKNSERIIAICTNGQLLKEHLQDILLMGENVELLIAVDGLQQENNIMRGKGTFEKTINNIKMLLELRKTNQFLGKISIHFVINENMIGKIYNFLEFFEQLGVDSVILCYPWYISQNTSLEMDQYYEKNIGRLKGDGTSWYAFKYALSMEYYDEFLEERNKILGRVWKMHVRFQPELDEMQIEDFLQDKLKKEKYQCYSVCDRIEILPDGSVSSCKHFPEFIVGNLKDSSLDEIWRGHTYNERRKMIQRELMPVCTKCNNLYLHGRRKLHEE